MAARAVCSATITFSLVSVPVKLYLTASPEKATFVLLTPDGHRVRQKWVDGETGTEINYEDLCRGVEVGKNQFVKFTKEEIDGLVEQKSGSIEIDHFSSDIELNPLTVEKPYFLVPDGSDKAYRMLLEAVKQSGKAAVGTWFNRGKDNLIAITVLNDVLVLNQLYYLAERRTIGQVYAKGSEPNAKEVNLAKTLVQKLSESFDLTEYKDAYLERLGLAVAEKQAGVRRGFVEEKAHAVAMDLADLLIASLENEDKA